MTDENIKGLLAKAWKDEADTEQEITAIFEHLESATYRASLFV